MKATNRNSVEILLCESRFEDAAGGGFEDVERDGGKDTVGIELTTISTPHHNLTIS